MVWIVIFIPAESPIKPRLSERYGIKPTKIGHKNQIGAYHLAFALRSKNQEKQNKNFIGLPAFEFATANLRPGAFPTPA